MPAANANNKLAESPTDIISESVKFINKCTKPDAKEYFGIVRAVGTGFLVMGGLGFVVKLIHIPIRYYITV